MFYKTNHTGRFRLVFTQVQSKINTHNTHLNLYSLSPLIDNLNLCQPGSVNSFNTNQLMSVLDVNVITFPFLFGVELSLTSTVTMLTIKLEEHLVIK